VIYVALSASRFIAIETFFVSVCVLFYFLYRKSAPTRIFVSIALLSSQMPTWFFWALTENGAKSTWFWLFHTTLLNIFWVLVGLMLLALTPAVFFCSVCTGIGLYVVCLYKSEELDQAITARMLAGLNVAELILSTVGQVILFSTNT
jgi:apolipoprotein N-acyltransferase